MQVSATVVQKIEECWEDSSIHVDTRINELCATFHHPYNVDEANTYQMKALNNVWFWLTTTKMFGAAPAMAQRLGKEAIAAKQIGAHTHARTRTEHREIKMDTVATIINESEEQGVEADTAAAETSAVPMLSSIEVGHTSVRNPNPMDRALESVSGEDLPKVFQQSTIPDVLAQPGMGNLLKDCAVQLMVESGDFKTENVIDPSLLDETVAPPKEMLALLEATLEASSQKRPAENQTGPPMKVAKLAEDPE